MIGRNIGSKNLDDFAHVSEISPYPSQDDLDNIEKTTKPLAAEEFGRIAIDQALDHLER